MAVGITSSKADKVDIPGKMTYQVFLCTLIAAMGGLMFGYDIGISGGVTSMDTFLEKFFPEVYAKKHRAKENNYCKFDNPYLQLFTSSLYLAAIVASSIASTFSRRFGRKPTMQVASVFFLVGALLNLFAQNLPMLIIGRLLLGVGIGFGNQAVPLFISEIAPANYRGGLNITFQLLITIGILIANIINAAVSKYPRGWRYALGGATVPALLLGFGSLAIVETPASLIERGKTEEGLSALKRIRGVDHDVTKEYEELLQATERANKVKNSFKNLLLKRSSWPQLVCGTIIHVFQQFTGINVIMFYAPVLFQTMGFESDASLLSAVLTGGFNAAATIVAICTVDRFGRKVLLLEGALQMVISQVIMGIVLKVYLHSTNVMHHGFAKLVVCLIVCFVVGFAWSWGPLGWLISSEIYPLETRNAGFWFALSTNMLCTFIIAQTFLTMLCHMRSGIFFFFAAWLVAMGIFTIFFLPETKGVPMDEMNERVWKQHWFWKRDFFWKNDNYQEEAPEFKAIN